MNRLRVIIPPIVQEQIRDQVLYIAADSIDNALAWEDRLRVAIADISSMPADAIDEEASRRIGRPIRKKVFEATYLIHYWIDETSGIAQVLNFRHGMRLPRWGEP